MQVKNVSGRDHDAFLSGCLPLIVRHTEGLASAAGGAIGNIDWQIKVGPCRQNLQKTITGYFCGKATQ
jgi:hypothetical protein